MNIKDIFDLIVKERVGEFNGIVGVVNSVDSDTKTCEVQDLRDAITTKVRLTAANTNGAYYVPKVGSVVIIHQISDQDYYVSMFSELDSIKFFDGSFGGLTKTQELKSQLDKVNAQLQAVITALSSWTVVASDGGSALKVFFAAQIAGKTAGDFGAIESAKITHGQ